MEVVHFRVITQTTKQTHRKLPIEIMYFLFCVILRSIRTKIRISKLAFSINLHVFYYIS